jgi:hypothetical protein
MNPSTFNSSLPHIIDNGNIFQVLDKTGTNWDEEKTAQIYHDWLMTIAGTITSALKSLGTIH